MSPLSVSVFGQLYTLRRDCFRKLANRGAAILDFDLMNKIPILAIPRITQNEGAVR